MSRTLPVLPTTLSCGGKGPCCHIGYPHRHCEHCDTVIPTQQSYIHWNPVYPGGGPTWRYGTTTGPAAPNFLDTHQVTIGAGTGNTAALAATHNCEVT